MSENKTRSWIKDIIYIFLFLCAVAGYFIDRASTNATETATVKSNTEAIYSLTKTMDKFNDNMVEDAEFKGKVLQYMISTDKDITYIKQRMP